MKEFVEFCCSLIFLLKGRTKQAKALKAFEMHVTAGSNFQSHHHHHRVSYRAMCSCGLACDKVAKTHGPVASLFSAKEEQK